MLAFPDLPPIDPSAEIQIASQGTSAGLAQTDGVQIIALAYLRADSMQLGAQWRNIDSHLAHGVAAFFLKYSGRFGQTRFDIGGAYRVRTGLKQPHDSRAWEFNVAASRRFGRIALRLGAEYSPKDFESGRSLYVDCGPSYALDAATKFSVNIGRRERVGSRDYTSFNAGITRVVKQRLTLDARYYGTNRGELGERFDDRLVVSARLFL